VAVQVEESIRAESDTPARFAPTTFGILLPTAPPEGAMVVARRLTEYAARVQLQQEGVTHVTLSFGIVSTDAPGEVSAEEFIKAGREALEEAVSWGGAQVVQARLPKSA
ncbi:MAG: diguanylate cyclase, partial [Chrysiogenetes bacterium]|nr:diguanylate cyclase [Chrysiogenetes bacterium]